MLTGSDPPVGFGFWAGLAAAGAALQLVAVRRGQGGLGWVLGRLLRRWPVRLVLLAGWVYGGWHVFVH